MGCDMSNAEGVEAYTVNDLRAMARAAGLAGFSRPNSPTRSPAANRPIHEQGNTPAIRGRHAQKLAQPSTPTTTVPTGECPE